MSQVDPSQMSRTQQVRESWRITRESDPAAAPLTIGAFVVGAVIGFVLFWLLPATGILGWIFAVVGALLLGLILAVLVFGRRAQSAAYKRLDGQMGAAAGALNLLRRGWTSTPAVGFNKQQDLVHRVVGAPGVILIGEGGSHSRIQGLLATERTKHQRVLADTPVTELIVGNGDGEVPLPKLVSTITKMKRQVKPSEITDILNRLKALDATRGAVPLPKGPMPTSMRGARQAMRGR